MKTPLYFLIELDSQLYVNAAPGELPYFAEGVDHLLTTDNLQRIVDIRFALEITNFAPPGVLHVGETTAAAIRRAIRRAKREAVK
jgi:hypothetical protein